MEITTDIEGDCKNYVSLLFVEGDCFGLVE